MEGDFSDFRLDPDLLDVIKILLEQGMSYAAISKAVDVDHRTVKRIDLRMKELQGIEVEKKKEEPRYVSITQYQNALNKIKNLEEKCNEQIRLYKGLTKFIDNEIATRVNYLRDRSRSLSEGVAANSRDIGYLKYDVRVIKEVRKLEIANFMEKSAKRRLEREQAREESNKRVVEIMEEEKRRRERGSVDVSFKKIEELKNMDKKSC